MFSKQLVQLQHPIRQISNKGCVGLITDFWKGWIGVSLLQPPQGTIFSPWASEQKWEHQKQQVYENQAWFDHMLYLLAGKRKRPQSDYASLDEVKQFYHRALWKTVRLGALMEARMAQGDGETERRRPSTRCSMSSMVMKHGGCAPQDQAPWKPFLSSSISCFSHQWSTRIMVMSQYDD